MLAKVLKSGLAEEFTAFPFPEIGAARPSSGVTDFIVPALAEFHFAPTASLDPMPSELPYAEDVMQTARREAARIIAQAEESRILIEEAAQEKALLNSRTAFDIEVAAKVEEIRSRMTETLEHLAGLAGEITAHAELDLVELALRIAKKIVGREVVIDPDIALTLVKVSLAKLNNRSVAVVHLNPDDLAFVETHRDRLDFRGAIELVEDRSVSVGGCLIHTETGDIDARIESQFDEIAHGLIN